MGISSQYSPTIHNPPTAHTISVRNFANGTYNWPYTVPATVGSQRNWTLMNGTISSGQTNNTANLVWAQPAATSITGNIYKAEPNLYGRVGDTSIIRVTVYRLASAENRTHVIVSGGTLNPCIISNANAEAASVQVRNGGDVHTINNRTLDIKGKCLTLPPN